MGIERTKIIILLLLLLTISGCAWWPPIQEKLPESDAQEELQQEKRQQLSHATDQLLAVSPEENPELYASRRRALEQALTEYLTVADSSERDIVLLHHDGSIVILPVTRPDSVRSAEQFIAPLTLWKTVGPEFQGEILDMAWIPSKGQSNGKLVALFQDSLTVLAIEKARSETIYTRTLPQETIPSMWPAAALMVYRDKERDDTGLNAITTKLSNALILHVRGNTVESETMSNPVKRSLAVKSWQTHSGQGLFRNNYLPSGAFRSLRLFPDAGKAVVLDSAGYLNLLDMYSMDYQWRSERPWGDRLYQAGDHTVAVLQSGQPSFVVFEINGNQLTLAGQSPDYNRAVCAVSAATMNTVDGLLVGLYSQQGTSRLQFLPVNKIQWQSPVDYPVPEVPDYHAELSVISSELPGDSTSQTIPSNIAHNVYQTLFTVDRDRTVQPLLASSSQHVKDWKTWEIYLRQDLQFSDGTAFTAQSVKSSWETRWKTCRTQVCPSQWLWYAIDGASDFLDGQSEHIPGIEIIDEHTLRINLTAPLPYFIEHLTQPAFRIDKQNKNAPYRIGIGPFQVKSDQTILNSEKATNSQISTPQSPWNLFSILHASPTASPPETSPLQLTRNSKYRGGYAPIQQVKIYPKSLQYSDSLVQKRNIINQVRNQRDIAYYRKLDQVLVRQFPIETTYFLAINPSRHALTNRVVRRKIATILDKEVTVNVIDEAECSVASRFFGSEIPSLSSPEVPDSLMPAQPLRITYPGKDLVARQIAERLAARLSQQDIPNSVPEAIPPHEFHQHRTSGDYDILIDSYTPQFGTDSYNIAALLHQGYVVDAGTMVSMDEHLSASPETYPEDIETTLIEDGILVPVFNAKSYAILPEALHNIELRGAYKFDISRAWFPVE